MGGTEQADKGGCRSGMRFLPYVTRTRTASRSMVNLDQTSKHGRGGLTSIWLECTQLPGAYMEAQAIRPKRDDNVAKLGIETALAQLHDMKSSHCAIFLDRGRATP
jgi:hypothetical protein